VKTFLALAVAWLGFLIHNLADLPDRNPLIPETLYPSLVYLVLALAWLIKPGRVTTALLLFWVGLNLLGGGIISVLPLPFLPFAPEQTVYHYAFHVVYAVSQIPALILLLRRWRELAPLKTRG
jgi:hypothetical protein